MDLMQAAQVLERYEAASVEEETHANDVMYNTGKAHYFTVGRNGLKVVLDGLCLTRKQSVNRILDLPCGHGRVSRHLRAAFPSAKMYFCDIDAEGAQFCASRFSGEAIVSKPQLLDVALPRDLDVIWVGSLFTHLDRARTSEWLAYLADHLSAHGILVATFHGYFTAEHRIPGGGADRNEALRGFQQSGWGYAPYADSDLGDYGFALSKPSTVLDIAASIPGTRVLGYVERGWANNQDVLVICRHDRLLPFGGKEHLAQ